jgi:gamma-D-glutamyl-L-lysine dipeptidyl-peptidase
VRNNLPLLNVYKRPDIKSEIVTQLLYGDTFKKIKIKGSWIKIRNNLDNYLGFIKNKTFPENQKATHKICNLYANLYSQPNNKKKIKKKLSFGSRVKIKDKKNNFYKFDNLWIKKNQLKIINYKTENAFKNIKKFYNTKYIWGGKHFSGVDCSGLIQLFLNFNNQFCPRDAKDQIKFFKKSVKLKNIKKNDLIFWKGHVAVVLTKNKLIHAYGPLKKVTIMPIKKTIDRIYQTSNLKIIGIKRIY